MVSIGLAELSAQLRRTSGRALQHEKDKDERLLLQKGVFLLQFLGHPLAAPYAFTMYLNGPYSPDLARDYYGKWEPAAPSKAALQASPGPALAVVGEALRRGPEFAEALGTLVSIQLANPGYDRRQLQDHFLFLKPRLKGKLEEAWQFLRDRLRPLVPTSTRPS